MAATTDEKMTPGEYAEFKRGQQEQMLTDHMIQMIEQQNSPWQRGWVSNGHGSYPVNGVSGKAYRGINAMLTEGASIVNAWTDGRFYTHVQITNLGGSVRKGEHGIPIVYPAFGYQRQKKDEHGKLIRDNNGQPVKEWVKYENGPRMKYSTVFAAEQCENVPEMQVERERFVWENNDRIDKLIKNYGIKVNEGGNRAFYLPSTDEITIPERDQFTDAMQHGSTLLHEAAHSTGAKHRLNREGITGGHMFASPEYAEEELVAEFTSCFLTREYGLAPNLDPNHFEGDNQIAYAKSWLKALRNDKSFVFKAIQQASKAQDFLMQYDPERIKAKELMHDNNREKETEQQAEHVGSSTIEPDPQNQHEEKLPLTVYDGFGQKAYLEREGSYELITHGNEGAEFTVGNGKNYRAEFRFEARTEGFLNWAKAFRGEVSQIGHQTVYVSKGNALAVGYPADVRIGRQGDSIEISVRPSDPAKPFEPIKLGLDSKEAALFSSMIEAENGTKRRAIVEAQPNHEVLNTSFDRDPVRAAAEVVQTAERGRDDKEPANIIEATVPGNTEAIKSLAPWTKVYEIIEKNGRVEYHQGGKPLMIDHGTNVHITDAKAAEYAVLLAMDKWPNQPLNITYSSNTTRDAFLSAMLKHGVKPNDEKLLGRMGELQEMTAQKASVQKMLSGNQHHAKKERSR